MTNTTSALSRKTRLTATLLALAMLFGLLPFAALRARAEENVMYLDANGRECFTSATVITESSTTWSGWYVAEGSVTISSRVTVSGSAYLILADNAELNIPMGISVTLGNTFTIYAQSSGEEMGKLVAGGSITSSSAGIGGYTYYSNNKLISTYANAGVTTINGGYVHAISGGDAAAIGGGWNGCGCTITINGGNIVADATSGHGAGIGQGSYGTAGYININGGVIKAVTGAFGAGIGGGGYTGAYGTITIKGGTIVASACKGVSNGIGGGHDQTTSKPSTNGTIKITGNAFIVTDSIGSISGTKSGVVLVDKSGQVYGTSVALQYDASIPSSGTLKVGNPLTISKGVTLTVPVGTTLTNTAGIVNNGTLDVQNGLDISSIGKLTGTGVTVIGGTNYYYVTTVADPEDESSTTSQWCSELPEAPENDEVGENATFGWYTEATGGTQVTTLEEAAGKTLYARWEAKTTGGKTQPKALTGDVTGNTSVKQDSVVQSGQTLTVKNGVTLTVKDGATLTIEEGADLSNIGQIIVEPGGQLIIKGKLSNEAPETTGDATSTDGQIKVADGATLTVESDATLANNGTLDSDGTLNLSQGAKLASGENTVTVDENFSKDDLSGLGITAGESALMNVLKASTTSAGGNGSGSGNGSSGGGSAVILAAGAAVVAAAVGVALWWRSTHNTVQGVAKDENGNILANATVNVYQWQNGQHVAVQVAQTDGNGVYKIKAPKGEYTLTAMYTDPVTGQMRAVELANAG